MHSSLKIAFASFLVAAAAIKAVPAFAEPVQPLENVAVVHTADLDLSTNAGRHQLDRRLVVAAAEVCGSASDTDLAGQNDLRLCRKDVLAKARARSDALHAARSEEAILLAARR
jgi:UrcA family protein